MFCLVDEIYTVPQTAAYLKICDKTVRRLIDRGILVASKVGKSWRIQKKDIDDYLKQTQNKASGGNIK